MTITTTGASNRTSTLGDTTALATIDAQGRIHVLCACGEYAMAMNRDYHRCVSCGRIWAVAATCREVTA